MGCGPHGAEPSEPLYLNPRVFGFIQKILDENSSQGTKIANLYEGNTCKKQI